MPVNRYNLALLIVILASPPAQAQGLEILEGKFAFNLHARPSREKCVKVAGPLLDDFKSAKYRCDLKVSYNTSRGAAVGVRTCTETRGRKEYLIFETQRACDNERKDQAANE